jgi:hypothetical protein
MHSLPAMFSLPIYIRPDRFRSLTALIVLLVCFVAIPFAKADYELRCPISHRHGYEIVQWHPEREFLTLTTYSLGFRVEGYCIETSTIPWWQVDAIVH